MQTLDAFGECHPLVTIHGVIRRAVRGVPWYPNRVFQLRDRFHMLYKQADPAIFADPNNDVWLQFRLDLLEAVDEINDLKGADDAELELASTKLALAAETYQKQYALVDSYARLFTEGIDFSPIDRFARQQGIHVRKLDRVFAVKLPLIDYMCYKSRGMVLDKGEDEEAGVMQAERERSWCRRMRKTEQALLIAGEAHVNGKYELKDRLLKKEVVLNPIAGEGYSRKVADMKAQEASVDNFQRVSFR
ncbi:MAG: hypothetical protein OXR66_03280 [Candidatus Woesearchaeota archaeon]|nr:hypothetical protein [Candidatus Woesearchaeota archaeon]